MKKIPLTREMFAIVDDKDFEWLNQWNWHTQQGYKTWYAVRKSKGKRIKMHRQILGCTKNEQVDHRNGNGLDNQRHNIRKCTRSQNMQNLPKREGGSSIFKGVSWEKTCNKWRAGIKLNGKRTWLGVYVSDTELFGEFACLNIV